MAEAVVAERGLIGDLRDDRPGRHRRLHRPSGAAAADKPTPALGAVPVPAGTPAQTSR